MCRSLEWEKREEIAACVSRGYGVIVLDKDPIAYAGFNVDHFISCDVTDVEGAMSLALSYISKHGLAIAGVVGWTDTGVYLVAQLALELGLPGTHPDKVAAVKDKVETRKLLEMVEGANPSYRIGHTVADLEDAILSVGVPCILKYPGASGGRGIIKIDDEPDDINALYIRFRSLCDPSKDAVFKHQLSQFLVEKQVRGSEHSIAGMVYKGKVTILAIVDKQVEPQVGYQYRNSLPSGLPILVQNQMCEIARKAILKSGTESCGFHVDIMVENNIPYVLEIGGRLGGECINSHIIPMASGNAVKPYEMLIDIVTGKDVTFDEDYRTRLTRPACMLSLYSTRYGRITAMHGLDTCRELPGVKSVLQVRKVGDTISPPSEKYNALVYAHVLMTHDSLPALEKATDHLRHTVMADVTSTQV